MPLCIQAPYRLGVPGFDRSWYNHFSLMGRRCPARMTSQRSFDMQLQVHEEYIWRCLSNCRQ